MKILWLLWFVKATVILILFSAPPYNIGSPGEATCISGYCPILSLSKCNDARNSLAISGWNANMFQAAPLRLPYCWIGVNGKANYNPNGDSGSNSGKAKIICERCGRFHITLPKIKVSFSIFNSYEMMIRCTFTFLAVWQWRYEPGLFDWKDYHRTKAR